MLRTFQIGLTLAAGVVLAAMALKPQQTPPVGPVWEYASVSGSPNRTTTCYASASACRNEQTSTPLDSAQAAEAMMVAAAKLGEKGWELAATGDGSGGAKFMYFKRLRSVINRGDSR
jgi:hypothetical protein